MHGDNEEKILKYMERMKKVSNRKEEIRVSVCNSGRSSEKYLSTIATIFGQSTNVAQYPHDKGS